MTPWTWALRYDRVGPLLYRRVGPARWQRVRWWELRHRFCAWWSRT